MSTQNFLRSSAIGAICIAGLSIAVSANAQGSRYGGSIHDYEGSSNCGQSACAAPVATHSQSSRYGGSYVEQVPAAPVYVDCRTTFGPQCGAPVVHQPTTVYTQPAPVYSAPAQTYSEPAYSAPTYTAQAPANCPAGTTAQSDGTCLQGSSYGSSSYGVGSATIPDTYSQSQSYSTDSYSATMPDTYSQSQSYSAGPPANCPAGTTAQSDGTCMQGGSSSYGSSSSYSTGSTSSYSGSSVEIYSGDAQPSQPSSYGYTSDGSYTATDYMPIRK